MAFQVFVSYASRDDEMVSALVASLERHLKKHAPRPSIWRDRHRIRPSDHFDRVIEDGLNASDVLLIALSGNWLASEYCRRELEIFTAKMPAGEEHANSAVVVAALHEVPFAQRPALLQKQVGYKFFDREPEAIDELAAELARDIFARIETKRAAAAANLPLPKTKLVGRRGEIDAVAKLLETHALVTIAGPGGVGKTRLALEIAAQRAGAAEHGEAFVNLAPLTDGSLIAATMLAALDSSNAGDGDAERQLLERLRDRDTLLLLDNCEHVLEPISDLVGRILERCPRVSIIATSREALHLETEQIYRLQPLPEKDAYELFVQRARAVQPAFDAAASEAAVRCICERLDGIPLAIELAAARVRALSAADILRLLDERFRLLTGGSKSALPRQQTLAALIAWSYDLLNDDERSLFRRLAVFRGSFTLAAAASVCAAGGSCDEFFILDVLTSLADKSLLTVRGDGETRYGMLETIREFALQKAGEHGEAASAGDQHAKYFASLAEQAYREFDTKLPEGWLDRLRPDLDNFRAALSWTLEAGGDRIAGTSLASHCAPMYMRMYLNSEGLRWIEPARRVDDAPPDVQSRLEYVASMTHNNLGEYRAALAAAEKALTFTDSLDTRSRLRVISQVAQLSSHAGNDERARSLANDAIEASRGFDDDELLASVLRRCAFALPTDEIDRARELFERALAHAKKSGDGEQVSRVLEWWAHREHDAGSTSRAIELLREAAKSASGGRMLSIELNLTSWSLGTGDLELARPHAYRSAELARAIEHPLARVLAALYCTPFVAERDREFAVSVFDYALERLARLEWSLDEEERSIATISRALSHTPAQTAVAPEWSDDYVLSAVLERLNTAVETKTAAARR